MAVFDPKQLLLKHVEKAVLLLAVVVLVWTLLSYPPWGATIPEAGEIDEHIENIRRKQETEYTSDPKAPGEKVVPPGVEEVHDYVNMISRLIEKPWSTRETGISEYPRSRVVFQDDVDVIWQPKAPKPPIVLAPTEILVKAEKGLVIVIFKIDQTAQMKQNDRTRVPEYMEGLKFRKVTITRKDVTTQEPAKDLHEGQDWLPDGLPRKYGSPTAGAATPGRGGARLDRPLPWQTTENVVVFTQRDGGADREAHRGIEDEMRRREEELRRRMKEAEQRRVKRPGAKRTRPAPRRTVKPAGPMARPTVNMAAQDGEIICWFVDNDVDTEGKYKYSVSLTVENPVFGSKDYEGNQDVPPLLISDAVTSKVVEVASFKEWYFTGGAPGSEEGWCVVRVLTSVTRQLDRAAVIELARQIRAGGDMQVSEPVGEWVEERFRVRPGQEIGGRKTVRLANGQAVDVDFATGIYAIALSEGIQVVENNRTKLVQDPNGGFVRVQILERNVIPKLKITVVDRKGHTYSQWRAGAVARD